METHRGRIVELYIRKHRYNITGLSRSLNISRSLLYHWFNKKNLSLHTIRRMGVVIKHDFSFEFSDILNAEDLKALSFMGSEKDSKNSNDEIWKGKYIALLKKVNRELQVL